MTGEAAGCDLYGKSATYRYSESCAWDPMVRLALDEARTYWSAAELPRDFLRCSRANEAWELGYLQGLAAKRTAALREILQENQGAFHGRLLGVIGVDTTDPAQGKRYFDVIALAAHADTFAGSAALIFKEVIDRPRPVQVCPAVAPLFCPGHPAFPSGHATQAMGIALTLAKAVEVLFARQGKSQADYLRVESQLLGLAEAIAVRREIAGVHFPSDTEAGFRLSRHVFGLRMADPAFVKMIEKAVDSLAQP